MARSRFPDPAHPTSNEQHTRRYVAAGRPLRVPPATAAIVRSGIVRLESLHEDGSAAIIGLAGRGQALIHHVDRLCHVHPIAHTDVVVEFESLDPTDALQAALVRRLSEAEAWLAMLAHRGAHARLRAFFALLSHGELEPLQSARPFTREQLAMATLTSRASIARALRSLRRTSP